MSDTRTTRIIRVIPALVVALLLALPGPVEGATKKKKKTPPAKARVKVPMKFDESTAPRTPRAKIGAAEKAAFRDAFVAGFSGRTDIDPALVAALAADLSDYYAIRQIDADEVARIRTALVAHLDLPESGPADLDALLGTVNAVTEGSNLDLEEMENVSAAVRAVAESQRVEKVTRKPADGGGERRKRRGFFRRLFGR